MTKVWSLLAGLVALAAIALAGLVLMDSAHAQTPTFAGTWSVSQTITTATFPGQNPGLVTPCNYTLTVSGTTLGGTFDCTLPTGPITFNPAGTISGNTASGTATGSTAGIDLPLKFNLTLAADGKSFTGKADLAIALGEAHFDIAATRTGGEPTTGGTAPTTGGTAPKTGGPLSPGDSVTWWLIPAGALLLSLGAATVYATRRS